MKEGEIIVATTTFYKSVEEVRFQMAYRMIRNAVETGYYTVVVVDGSPLFIRKQFEDLGAIVFEQTEKGMGGSRREVFWRVQEVCWKLERWTCVWVEPEKDDFIRSIPAVTEMLVTGLADVVIPRRSEESFRATYPKYQVASETLAGTVFRKLTGLASDPMFGPLAFNARASHLFADSRPEKFGLDPGRFDNYVQHYAPLEALGTGYRVGTVEVDFNYPKEQKEEEENARLGEIVEKRLWQASLLVEAYIHLVKVYSLFRMSPFTSTISR